jgi:hypothetical protein
VAVLSAASSFVDKRGSYQNGASGPNSPSTNFLLQQRWPVHSAIVVMGFNGVAWTNYDFRFGGVKAAKLIVTAPIAAVLWNPVSNPPGTAPMSGTITHIFPIAYDQQTAISAPPDIDSVADIRFDTVLDNAPQSLVLLPIISTTNNLAHETDLALGLVLHQTKVAAQFRRLGVFHTTRSQINRIIRKLPRQTVTIL